MMNQLLESYTRWIYENSRLIIITLPIFIFSCLLYISQNLGMNTDTRDMLSEDLQWRKLDIQYETIFPHTVDLLVIVVESEIPDLATQAANSLYQKIRSNPKLFRDSFYIKAEKFISNSGLLYKKTDELNEYVDQLAEQQAALAILNENPNLVGLFDLLIESINHGNQTRVKELVNEIKQTIFFRLKNSERYLSWENLFSDKPNNFGISREYILVQPVLDYSGIYPAAKPIKYIRQWQNALDIPVSIKLTGPVALAFDEFNSVSETNLIAIVVALILLTLVLLIGLGSWQMVLCIILTLLCGLVLTAAFATLTVGELNLISIAFAVLYIGLGVDFAIHYGMAYCEPDSTQNSSLQALISASTTTGKTLIYCALTTALGFFAFLPTDYVGVAELGWIAGCGMFISLLATLTLLPIFIKHVQLEPVRHQYAESSLWQLITTNIVLHYRSVLIITCILTALSLSAIGHMRFDNNTINLQSPYEESVLTYIQLSQETDNSPLYATLLIENFEQAQETITELEKLHTVKEVRWLMNFIPDNQNEKIAILDEISLLMGGALDLNEPKNSNPESRKKATYDLIEVLAQEAGESFRGLYNLLLEYQTILNSLTDEEQVIELKRLEKNLTLTLPQQIKLLQDSILASPISIDNLPDSFRKRWLNEGYYLLEIYPERDLSDEDHLKEFVESITRTNPDITGPAVVLVEAGKAVVSAFISAFIYAFLAICLLVLLLSHNKSDVFYIISTLILAALFTASCSVFFEIPFNFANIIALPLLLGIGVDSSIHILHRFRQKPDKNVLQTSTARAILLSVLTTILSIGNLAFSSHHGTASMGLLLSIGILLSLICTLIILPSLLKLETLKD